MLDLTFNKFQTILEIGVNHEGNVQSAIEIMKKGANVGGKIFKFQSYTPTRYISSSDSERLERVKKFSLSLEDFKKIKLEADKLNVSFISTPLTEDWVKPLSNICPAIKIASGDLTFKPVLKLAAMTSKPIILSTGGSTVFEIDEAINYLSSFIGKEELKSKLCLMHCISSYPTPLEQANLNSIPFLKERYNLKVGYSNHVIGIDACLTAIAVGADFVEVHFTDNKFDRSFHDHALSFDEDDLKNYFLKSKNVLDSLGIYDKVPQECEKKNLPSLRKGIVAAKLIKKNEILNKESLTFARPATNFSSNDIQKLIGKKVKSDIQQGEIIKTNHII